MEVRLPLCHLHALRCVLLKQLESAHIFTVCVLQLEGHFCSLQMWRIVQGPEGAWRKFGSSEERIKDRDTLNYVFIYQGCSVFISQRQRKITILKVPGFGDSSNALSKFQ